MKYIFKYVGLPIAALLVGWITFGLQSHAAATQSCVPTAPSQAQAAGYTNLVFDDEFSTLSLSPNGSGIYNWYSGLWYEVPNPSSDITPRPVPSTSRCRGSTSALSLTETMTDPHATSVTTFNRGAGPSTLFQYGYFEARMQMVPTNSLNPNQNWAAFWLFSAAHAQGKDTTLTGNEWCELDIFEGWGQSIFVGTIHDWVYATSSGLTNNQNTNNYQTLPGNPDLTQYHVYGVLWTPSAVTWYFDNAAVMSWPTYAICQSQQLFMILGAQVHPPQTETISTRVDWVHVFYPM
ncbi:MAG: glycoside hydrolase family 16 protein [Methylocella sp.]|jgi:beta-glucanase (GH16 family)